VSVPVHAQCHNRSCPSKQPVPALGFDKPAQSILAKIRRTQRGTLYAACLWCDEKATPLEDIEEIAELGR